jgi:hypothetical protein
LPMVCTSRGGSLSFETLCLPSSHLMVSFWSSTDRKFSAVCHLDEIR